MGSNHPTERPWAMRRFVLLAVGGVLGLIALLPEAHGQGRPGATEAAQKGKLRALAIARTPLADEHLSEGGLIVALARASLGQSGPGDLAGMEFDLEWTKASPDPPQLGGPSIDIALPVEGADCERPNDLTQSLAVLCDSAMFSEPMFQVAVGLFAPSDGTFKFDTDEAIFGKTICVAQDQDVAALNAGGRGWASLKRLTVLRRPTLLDCVAAVQGRAADAFAAPDLEGHYLLGRLGLAQAFAMQPRPLAVRGVHVVVARDHPRSAELIGALNRGLGKLKQSGAHTVIVQKHLASLWDGPAGAAAVAKPGAGPSVGGPPVPEAPKAASVVAPADRERALRLKKKGDEELADGKLKPARLLYERSAELGLAEGAMALAATYDAAELAKLNLLGVQPNAEQSRRWYERALALGAGDARQRLQRLGAK